MSEEWGNKNVTGRRLRELREELGLSQKVVVEMINEMGHSMTPSTISKIEKGNRSVSDRELMAFSRIYNSTIDALFSLV